MNKLEKDLIAKYWKLTNNKQIGGGRISYSNEYWIYVVHK